MSGEVRLPEEFSELEVWASKWCLETERERLVTKENSTMAEMTAFYDVLLPKAEGIVQYLNGYPIDALPPQQQNLYHLVEAFLEVSICVEFIREPVSAGFLPRDRVVFESMAKPGSP